MFVGIVVRTGKTDVRRINAIQAATADSCLYLHDDSPNLSYLVELTALNDWAKRQFRVEIRSGPIVEESETKRSQISAFNMPDVRLGQRFSFVRDVNRIDFTGYSLGAFPPRSHAQVVMAKRFHDRLRAESLEALKTRAEKKPSQNK